MSNSVYQYWYSFPSLSKTKESFVRIGLQGTIVYQTQYKKEQFMHYYVITALHSSLHYIIIPVKDTEYHEQQLNSREYS